MQWGAKLEALVSSSSVLHLTGQSTVDSSQAPCFSHEVPTSSHDGALAKAKSPTTSADAIGATVASVSQANARSPSEQSRFLIDFSTRPWCRGRPFRLGGPSVSLPGPEGDELPVPPSSSRDRRQECGAGVVIASGCGRRGATARCADSVAGVLTSPQWAWGRPEGDPFVYRQPPLDPDVRPCRRADLLVRWERFQGPTPRTGLWSYRRRLVHLDIDPSVPAELPRSGAVVGTAKSSTNRLIDELDASSRSDLSRRPAGLTRVQVPRGPDASG